ncbi:MAG: hypothetical protein J6D45_07325 [Clostridia bacterium]|nr:hypothetical protein [Clostridia bacterium]
MFEIKAYDLHWLEDLDDREDLCLHGRAVAKIGEDVIVYDDAAVSATALYLLKSLTEDHVSGEADVQMLPCCGHFMVANNSLSEVIIVGCANGIDWSVLHDGEYVLIVTDTQNEVRLHIDDYKRAVFEFADEIEAFYNTSAEKVFEDEIDRDAYTAFWCEWKRRRYS